MHNIFANIPDQLGNEVTTDILRSSSLRIERIVSSPSSPESDWYDQDEHEWVMVVAGAAGLIYEDGSIDDLTVGDMVNIPAHKKHKVAWTAANQNTIWLCIFYR